MSFPTPIREALSSGRFSYIVTEERLLEIGSDLAHVPSMIAAGEPKELGK